MTFRWALIHIKTSGLHIQHDKITEIAVMIVTEAGIENSWHTFINSDQQISNEITATSNGMVAIAKIFPDVAMHLNEMLRNCIVIAHNARFIYGFLKNAFRLAGIRFQPKLLCTMKLARVLYPKMEKYHLSNISEYFNFSPQQSHLLSGEELLHLFLKQCMDDFSITKLLSTIKTLTTSASIPSKLLTDTSTISNGPGVYLFYGESSSLPIYIGKSVNLRQRILSHFQADHNNAKEFKLAQQVRSIETIETAGELSALLLESTLIKEKMPLYNQRLRRKKRIVGFILNTNSAYITIQVGTQNQEEAPGHLLGAFSSVHSGKKILHELVMEYQLCPKLCGLEKSAYACFSYQLHRCKGACINKDNPEQYNLRLDHALSKFKQESWPYPSPIAIKEENINTLMTQWLVFDHWRHIKTVNCLSQINKANIETRVRDADKDTYHILRSYLNKMNSSHQLIVLNNN